MSVNEEENRANDKAKGGEISKGDLEGAALKVGGKRGKCGVLEATIVSTSQTEPPKVPYQMGYFATKPGPLEIARTLESLIAKLYRQTSAD